VREEGVTIEWEWRQVLVEYLDVRYLSHLKLYARLVQMASMVVGVRQCLIVEGVGRQDESVSGRMCSAFCVESVVLEGV
jgi:hypothetical protein